MWKYVKYAIPVAIFAFIGLFFYRGLSLNPTILPSPLIGKPMPEFSLPRLEDPERSFGSRDLAGGVALLNVWGEWCVECWREHAFLLELARSGRVPIYGLNTKDERAKALGMLAQLGNPFVTSGFDADGGVAVDWGVYGAPESFLIGPDGTVLHKRVSILTPEVWQREFEPLLTEICGDDPCPRPPAAPSTSALGAAAAQ